MDDVLRKKVADLAATSSLAHYNWPGRGQAPIGYTKGLAIAFAQAYEDLKKGESYAKEMAKPIGGDSHRDVLRYYNDIFATRDMLDDAPPDNLRHLFVLMYGLGMRESSGEYGEGRDMSVPTSQQNANTAEAGMFQQSWDSKDCSQEMVKLFTKYHAGSAECLLNYFKEGAAHGIRPDFGVGQGAEFQHQIKQCPMYAVASAGVALRNLRTHWGPINRKEAGVRPEANNLLLQVQKVVDDYLQPPVPTPEPTPQPAPTPQPSPPPTPAPVVVHNDWPSQSHVDSYYGNPRRGSAWQNENLVDFTPPWKMVDEETKHPVPHFKVHRKVKASLDRIFARAWEFYHKSQAEIEQNHLHLFSGCYVFRNIRGGNTLSMHSYGIALDIAAGLNEMGRPYNPQRGLPMAFIRMFQDEGWTWGGRWTRPDPMHFQAADVGADV